MLLSSVGPVVTVVLGGVLVGGVVSVLQRRHESREAFRDLTVDMFQIAYGFYVQLEDARRRRRYGEPESTGAELDAAFQDFVVAGRTTEARLRVAGTDDDTVRTRWSWHCVLDLLTVLFFQHRHTEQRVGDLIAAQQCEHELTRARDSVSEPVLSRLLESTALVDADSVKRKFAQAMDELILLRR